MDNRDAILSCALDLFARRGYDAVGVQEIVEVAGITKPTLYHYFGSKRGLLDALLAENFKPLNQMIRERAAYRHDLLMNLRRLVGGYFFFARQNRTFYRMALALSFAPPESEANQAVMRWMQEQYQVLENLFAQAAVDHGNMKGRQRAYAATFIGMINTYISLFLNNSMDLNDDELSVQAVQQFMHGIFS